MTPGSSIWDLGHLAAETRFAAETAAAETGQPLAAWLAACIQDAARKELGVLPPEKAPQAPLGRYATLVPIASLRPSPYRSRQTAEPIVDESLLASVAAQGILEPLLVRRDPEHPDGYEIVTGARRWNAARQNGLAEAPVVISSLTDGEALMVSLVENLDHEDFSPFDEGRAYLRLLTEFRIAPPVLVATVRRDVTTIATAIRSLALPSLVHHLIESGQLEKRHIPALLAAVDPERLADALIEDQELSEESDAGWTKLRLPDDARRLAGTAADAAGLTVEAWIERIVPAIAPRREPEPDISIGQSLSALIQAARRHAGGSAPPGPGPSDEWSVARSTPEEPGFHSLDRPARTPDRS